MLDTFALEALRGDVLRFLLYSTDVALSDYYLFLFRQSVSFLEGFSFYAEIQNWFDDWIALKQLDFFHCGLKQINDK